MKNYVLLAGGGKVACGLSPDGYATCWGTSLHGVLTPPSDTFAALSVGGEAACGVTLTGEVVCWGDRWTRHAPIRYAPSDVDRDGLSAVEEEREGTDPAVADTDGDGRSDGYEVSRGKNPLDPADDRR